ncbi:hypothetical protein HK098_003245 [Nowakowskiella sp. JEL0407]|nr:hypothetical protein HK098_003245 [Nowakowskiella sp. JEL0407]
MKWGWNALVRSVLNSKANSNRATMRRSVHRLAPRGNFQTGKTLHGAILKKATATKSFDYSKVNAHLKKMRTPKLPGKAETKNSKIIPRRSIKWEDEEVADKRQEENAVVDVDVEKEIKAEFPTTKEVIELDLVSEDEVQISITKTQQYYSIFSGKK